MYKWNYYMLKYQFTVKWNYYMMKYQFIVKWNLHLSGLNLFIKNLDCFHIS